MPTVIITQNPVLEDALYYSLNSQGSGGGAGPFPTNAFGTPAGAFAGPFEFGGTLYSVGGASVVMPHPPPNWGLLELPLAYGPFVVLSSADGGATWAFPDLANRPYFAANPANPPQVPAPVMWQRIGNKIQFALLVVGLFIPPFVSGNSWMAVGAFDLATETYDPIAYYDTGWPSFGAGVLSPAAVFFWPVDVLGALTFIGQDQDNRAIVGGNPNPDLGKGRLILVPSVGGYPALTDITPAALSGAPNRLFVIRNVLVDATGIAHVVFSSLDSVPPGADEQYWYMKVHPDTSTSAFQQLVVPSPPGVGTSFGIPAFSGADLLIPLWFNGDTLAVFRVENYAALVPSVAYEPITLGLVGTGVSSPAVVIQGTRAFLFYNAGFDPVDLIEVDYSYNDGSGWSVGDQFCPGTLIVVPPGHFNNERFFTLSAALLSNGDFGIVSGSQFQTIPPLPIFFGNANIFLGGNFDFPVPPVAPVIGGRGGSRRMLVLIPNRFDRCLIEELQAHRHVQPARPCCEPMLWRDIVWIRAPKDFVPFRKTAAIPTPLAAAGDVEVLNFEVPPGYDGLIAGLFNMYTGPGFREGNGDIEWRLLINRTYAVHLGQVLVTLGGQNKPYPVDGGIFIQSGTHIRYIVSVPNLSGGIVPLVSRIVCGLEGLFYARA
jgi:hypothetical protein